MKQLAGDASDPRGSAGRTLPQHVALLLAAAALFSLGACSAPRGEPRLPARAAAPWLELVESTPVETTLDHPELRAAAAVWLEMVQGASRSIDLAQFYLSNAPGSRLEPVVVALEEAAARGVRVRVLAERKFQRRYPDTLDRLARAGAAVRLIDLSQVSGGILHAKYFVVDEREAFLGSQNFDWRALEHIYELGARVRAPSAVAQLGQVFAADWARAAGEPPPPAAPIAVPPGEPRLVASPRELLPAGVAWDLPELVALIDSARTTVRVQALTYLASEAEQRWDELEAPLLRAAARGVKVELLLSNWSLGPNTLPGLRQLLRARPGDKLEIRISTIPPWSGGHLPYARVAHAKLLMVDSARGWLGTSNWERDYFYQSRNVGLLLSDGATLALMERFFASLWSASYTRVLGADDEVQAPKID